MGPELAAALAVSLAGTGLQMMDARSQQKQQRSILNRQMERNEEATDKAVDMVQDEAQNFDSQSRMDQMRQAQNKTYAQTQADLEGAGGALVDTAGDAGNVSDDFLKTKAARAIEEGNRMTAIAREAARVRAPGSMRLEDSLRMGSLVGDTASLWGTTKNMANANALEAQSVGPGSMGALGAVAGAIGQGMAMRGMAPKPGAMPGVPPNPYATGPYRVNSGINFGAR